MIALVGLALAGILSLQIPLGNMQPGFALSLFPPGILKRDGSAVLSGWLSCIVRAVLVGGVLYGLMKAGLFITQNTVGL
jgi:hypothetical protein